MCVLVIVDLIVSVVYAYTTIAQLPCFKSDKDF